MLSLRWTPEVLLRVRTEDLASDRDEVRDIGEVVGCAGVVRDTTSGNGWRVIRVSRGCGCSGVRGGRRDIIIGLNNGARDYVDVAFASEGLVFLEVGSPVLAEGDELRILWQPVCEMIFW